jgi:probable HAF family extracellular repeat protein
VTNGKASVAIPANALAADSYVSVNPASGTLPNAPENMQILGGTAFDFGPTGLKFNTGTPATISIQYNAASMPPGVPESSISVYTLVSGAWVQVAGSSVSTVTHTVTLPVSHFSVYALICPAFTGQGVVYDVVDLGVPAGAIGATGLGLSSDGKVCGYSVNSDQTLHAFLWQDGQFVDLGKLEGDNGSVANGVNSSGIAVGYSNDPKEGAFPVMFDHGTVTQLDTEFGPGRGNVTAINDAGDYILAFAFFHDKQPTHFVGFVPSKEPTALNSSGSVAGTGEPQAAIWSNGHVQYVGILPGYDYATGVALSDSGILVGTAAVGGEDLPVGFIYRNGTMSKISPVTGDNILQPHGVNDSGAVVGVSSSQFITTRAFVYKDGVTTQLDTLISRATGWTIPIAYSINNKGQILALGVNGGAQHAILLNPKTGS